MATVTVPEFPLRDEAPPGFVPEESFALELTYKIVGGQMEFSYRTAVVPDGGQFLLAPLAQAKWTELMPIEDLRVRLGLDIDVKRNCIIVLLTDRNEPLFWSLAKDAITTMHDRSDFYFELRYRDGSDSVRRTEYSRPSCREVSFKARLNDSHPNDVRHKFNINVVAKNAAGQMEEVLIDPDIKNPSV